MDWSKMVVDILTFHKGKLIGVILGLIFGIFTIQFGFWSALFIAICIFVGYFLGRRVDEATDFKALLRKFLGDSQQ